MGVVSKGLVTLLNTPKEPNTDSVGLVMGLGILFELAAAFKLPKYEDMDELVPTEVPILLWLLLTLVFIGLGGSGGENSLFSNLFSNLFSKREMSRLIFPLSLL